MSKSKGFLYILVVVIAVILLSGGILSIFQDTESRFLKMLDFPRIQFFLSSAFILLIFIILTKKWHIYDYFLIAGLAVAMIIQASYLINYTSLVSPTVSDAEESVEEKNKISLLLANIKMSNRNAQPFLDLVEKKSPDVLLVMEVNEWWDKQLAVIEKKYPYKKETINEVAYGMALYSKLPMEEVTVNYLNNEKVPSFFSKIKLKNGREIGFHAVHPVPPTFFEDLPDNKGQQEKAMIKVGKKIENSPLPSIVAGDFNDVVWSYTNQLTEKKGLLRDVRVGRGFYNSYNAENILLRWPLDHIFVTEEFRLKKLERLPSIDSDHFPIYVELVL